MLTPRPVRKTRAIRHPVRHARRKATHGILELAVYALIIGAVLHAIGVH